MPERPPIPGQGRVIAERLPGRLYDVEMPNGFRTLGIVPREGPKPPETPVDCAVTLTFSPYDLGHGRITSWEIISPSPPVASPG